MKAKTKKEKKTIKKTVDTDMFVFKKESGDTPMNLSEIRDALCEYQAVQRGGYWEHDEEKDKELIYKWHRAIDASITVLSILEKVCANFAMMKDFICNGDYPKVIPSPKSEEMEERKFAELSNCEIIGRAVQKKDNKSKNKKGKKSDK